MAQFRNITDGTLWVVTDTGTVEVTSDSILTVSDSYAAQMYFQVGDHGEEPIWEAVGGKSKKPTTIVQPAAADEKE